MQHSRSGAFAIATPNNIGFAVRRPDPDPDSGYSIWQVDHTAFVIASPALSGVITQAELADRVNSLARIHDPRSVSDIHGHIGDILNAIRVSDALEADMFEVHAHQVANQVAAYTNILHRDLIGQDLVPDIRDTIRQAAPRAIRGYIRGWYVPFDRVTKEHLVGRYRPEACRAVTNALREFDPGNDLVEEICGLIFDEILSYRLSPWAKQIIVTGFAYCKPKVGSVEFDGSYLGEAKINSSEHDPLWIDDQSFFFDAGNCYEVGRFARGLNSDAYSQALAITEELVNRVNKNHGKDFGMWRNLETLKPNVSDVATLALKSMEFSGAGLFGPPLHSLVKNANPSGILDALNVLCQVADLQDGLLGVKEPAWSEMVVLDQTGIIAKKESGAVPPKKALAGHNRSAA